MRRFFLIFWMLLITLAAHAGQPEAPKCSDFFHPPLNIEDIGIVQFGLRESKDTVESTRAWMKAHNGDFPKPIVLNLFDDGKYYVRDGHHRFQIAKDLGKKVLYPGKDYIVEVFSYERWSGIRFPYWVTPFDPRRELRFPQLQGFKELIAGMRASGVPDAVVEKFIYAHREAFSISLEELNDQGKKLSSFEGGLRDREKYVTVQAPIYA
jgi:hypothetical protein